MRLVGLIEYTSNLDPNTAIKSGGGHSFTSTVSSTNRETILKLVMIRTRDIEEANTMIIMAIAVMKFSRNLHSP